METDGREYGTHVARGIAPSFNGESLDATSYNPGAEFTKCFQFTLDPTWDLTKMHIIGMLINPNGQIDNASSTLLATSIASGYNACNSTSISNQLIGPDQRLYEIANKKKI